MFIVTGGAGFIGSNIIAGLNARGITDIIVVDDLTQGQKCHNLADLEFCDYFAHDEFLQALEAGEDLGAIEAVFHQGACSDTTEWDGRFMMQRNFTYSKKLYKWCQNNKIPFLYASSAAVYGGSNQFVECRQAEHPLNMYGLSKLAFDHYVRAAAHQSTSQVVGLRYFNVYGPRENHKGHMASVAKHFYQQIKDTGTCKLFSGSDGYADGEQRRDFIHVDDVVAVNLWLLDHSDISGIFNCGTGQSYSFNNVADAVINWAQCGQKSFIAFPEKLKGRYQSFTCADMSALRKAGYDRPFMPVDKGVSHYMQVLAKQN